MAAWVFLQPHPDKPPQSQSVIWSLHQTCTGTPAKREGEPGDNLSALVPRSTPCERSTFKCHKWQEVPHWRVPALHIWPPRAARLTSCIATATDRPLRLHMRVCVFHSTAEGRTRGRDPGRREQKKTTWHIPHIHFTPVKCDSCEARCPPPTDAGWGQRHICCYNQLFTRGRRGEESGSCLYPPPTPEHPLTLDTCRHPHPPPHRPPAFRWQGKDAFKDNVWRNCGAMLLLQWRLYAVMFPAFQRTPQTHPNRPWRCWHAVQVADWVLLWDCPCANTGS